MVQEQAGAGRGKPAGDGVTDAGAAADSRYNRYPAAQGEDLSLELNHVATTCGFRVELTGRLLNPRVQWPGYSASILRRNQPSPDAPAPQRQVHLTEEAQRQAPLCWPMRSRRPSVGARPKNSRCWRLPHSSHDWHMRDDL
jgi:hypothetical protein